MEEKVEEKGEESIEKVIEKPNKAPYNNIYHKNKRKFILWFLEKAKFKLIKYDKIDSKEDISDYLNNHIKKPLVKWFTSILLTAAVICLAGICLGFELPRVMPTSLGISLSWWLFIELVRDLKK